MEPITLFLLVLLVQLTLTPSLQRVADHIFGTSLREKGIEGKNILLNLLPASFVRAISSGPTPSHPQDPFVFMYLSGIVVPFTAIYMLLVGYTRRSVAKFTVIAYLVLAPVLFPWYIKFFDQLVVVLSEGYLLLGMDQVVRALDCAAQSVLYDLELEPLLALKFAFFAFLLTLALVYVGPTPIQRLVLQALRLVFYLLHWTMAAAYSVLQLSLLPIARRSTFLLFLLVTRVLEFSRTFASFLTFAALLSIKLSASVLRSWFSDCGSSVFWAVNRISSCVAALHVSIDDLCRASRRALLIFGFVLAGFAFKARPIDGHVLCTGLLAFSFILGTVVIYERFTRSPPAAQVSHGVDDEQAVNTGAPRVLLPSLGPATPPVSPRSVAFVQDPGAIGQAHSVNVAGTRAQNQQGNQNEEGLAGATDNVAEPAAVLLLAPPFVLARRPSPQRSDNSESESPTSSHHSSPRFPGHSEGAAGPAQERDKGKTRAVDESEDSDTGSPFRDIVNTPPRKIRAVISLEGLHSPVYASPSPPQSLPSRADLKEARRAGMARDARRASGSQHNSLGTISGPAPVTGDERNAFQPRAPLADARQGRRKTRATERSERKGGRSSERARLVRVSSSLSLRSDERAKW